MFILPAAVGLALTPAEPTSLLKLVAGEFAPQVAARWPPPHTEYLTAPAPRRHLVCLALLGGRDLAVLGEAILTERLRRVLPRVLPGAPDGLARALERIGDVAWSADSYRLLLGLLAEPRAAKVLRHAETIDRATVERLAALPASFATALDLSAELNPSAVLAVGEAFAAIRRRDGPAAAEAAAERWAKADSAKALSPLVRGDLCPEPAAPPFPATARLKPLVSKAEIDAAASRYRNCLADYKANAAAGWTAIYEWAGPPPVALEVSRDPVFGWRLDQARLADNAAVPEAVVAEIATELDAMGVHVGRNGWELDRALYVLSGPAHPLRPMDEALAEVFGRT